METRILDALAFTLTVPTPKSFLRRFLKAAAVGGTADPRLEFLAAYLCELTLPEYGALNFLASQIAASSVLLAQYILGRYAPCMEIGCRSLPLGKHGCCNCIAAGFGSDS